MNNSNAITNLNRSLSAFLIDNGFPIDHTIHSIDSLDAAILVKDTHPEISYVLHEFSSLMDALLDE